MGHTALQRCNIMLRRLLCVWFEWIGDAILSVILEVACSRWPCRPVEIGHCGLRRGR